MTKQSNALLGKSCALNHFYLVIGVYAFLLYANTLQNGFVLDDAAVLTQNKFVQKGFSGIPEILASDYWAGYWNTNSGVYRPIPLILFATEWELFGSNPMPGHLINVLLFTITALLLFRLLLKIFSCQPLVILFAAVLLFVAHPLHTEVVANIKSADELLAFFFILLSIDFWLKTREHKSIFLSFGSTLFFLLALLSKEISITFLFIIPLIYYFKYYKVSSLKVLIGTWLPFIVVSALYFFIRVQILGDHFTRHLQSRTENALIDADTFYLRSASVLNILRKYSQLLVYPIHQSFDYSYNQIPICTWKNPVVIITAILLVASIFFAVKNFIKRNLCSWSILYFIVTSSIVSNGILLINTTLAERLMYAPSLGFCIAASSLIYRKGKANDERKNISFLGIIKRHPLSTSVMLAILSIYSFKTISRNFAWKDNLTLFSKDVRNAPLSWKTHYCYGSELLQCYFDPTATNERRTNLLNQSITELRISLAIDSFGLQFFTLGQALYLRGDLAQATYYLEKYKAIFPRDKKAFEYLGYAYARSGKYDRAILAFKSSIALGNQSADIKHFLGLSQLELKDTKGAIESFSQALEGKPEDETLFLNLGAAYGNSGNHKLAVLFFRKALEINRSNVTALQGLATAYQELGKIDSSNYFKDRILELQK